jgi:hypothetical protein
MSVNIKYCIKNIVLSYTVAGGNRLGGCLLHQNLHAVARGQVFVTNSLAMQEHHGYHHLYRHVHDILSE